MRIVIAVLMTTYLQLGVAETEELTCGNHELAQKLAELIIAEPKQNRQNLKCDEQLVRIAHLKAQQLAEAQVVSHDVNHTTPNQLLRKNQFALPKEYSLFGNQVESLAGGNDVPQEILTDFMGSHLHRPHVLGEGDFFAAQNKIGVAYVRDPWTLHVDYWVVLIATTEERKKTQPRAKEVVSDEFKKALLMTYRDREKIEKEKEKNRRKTAYERRIKDKFGPPD